MFTFHSDLTVSIIYHKHDTKRAKQMLHLWFRLMVDSHKLMPQGTTREFRKGFGQEFTFVFWVLKSSNSLPKTISDKNKGEKESKKKPPQEQEERSGVANGNLSPSCKGRGGGPTPPPHIAVTRTPEPRGKGMNGHSGTPPGGTFQPRMPGPPQNYQ